MGKKKRRNAGPGVTLRGASQRFMPVYVEGRDEVYRIPLMSSLGIGDLRALRAAQKAEAAGDSGAYLDAFIEIAYRYIPKDVLDTLPLGQLGVLSEAWSGMEDAGESSASPSS